MKGLDLRRWSQAKANVAKALENLNSAPNGKEEHGHQSVEHFLKATIHSLHTAMDQVNQILGTDITSRITCMDCRSPTTEGYMVKDDVWLSVVPERKGRLHLSCLEKRLERELKLNDFTDAPINELIRWAWGRRINP